MIRGNRRRNSRQQEQAKGRLTAVQMAKLLKKGGRSILGCKLNIVGLRRRWLRCSKSG